MAYYRFTHDHKVELFGLIQESSALLQNKVNNTDFWHQSESGDVDFVNSKNYEYKLALTLKTFIEDLSKSEHPDYLAEHHSDFVKIWNKKKI